jgi:hypothetical protein
MDSSGRLQGECFSLFGAAVIGWHGTSMRAVSSCWCQVVNACMAHGRAGVQMVTLVAYNAVSARCMGLWWGALLSAHAGASQEPGAVRFVYMCRGLQQHEQRRWTLSRPGCPVNSSGNLQAAACSTAVAQQALVLLPPRNMLQARSGVRPLSVSREQLI